MTTKPAVHPYTGDGVPDHRGDDRCTVCGLPRDREVHQLPPTGADVREAEARRVGEIDQEG